MNKFKSCDNYLGYVRDVITEIYYTIRVWFFVLATIHSTLHSFKINPIPSNTSYFFPFLRPRTHNESEEEGDSHCHKSPERRPDDDIITPERMVPVLQENVQKIENEQQHPNLTDVERKIIPLSSTDNQSLSVINVLPSPVATADDFVDAFSHQSNSPTRADVNFNFTTYLNSYQHISNNSISPTSNNASIVPIISPQQQNEHETQSRSTGIDSEPQTPSSPRKLLTRIPKIARKVSTPRRVLFPSRKSKRNNMDIEAMFESPHSTNETVNRLEELLQSNAFGCDVSSQRKTWSNKFKMRVVTLSLKTGNAMVLRMIIDNKHVENGCSVTVYPARFGGGMIVEGKVVHAHEQFNEFFIDVKTAYGHGVNKVGGI